MRRDPAPDARPLVLICLPVADAVPGDPTVTACHGCAGPVRLSERRAAVRGPDTAIACVECYRGFLAL